MPLYFWLVISVWLQTIHCSCGHGYWWGVFNCSWIIWKRSFLWQKEGKNKTIKFFSVMFFTCLFFVEEFHIWQKLGDKLQQTTPFYVIICVKFKVIAQWLRYANICLWFIFWVLSHFNLLTDLHYFIRNYYKVRALVPKNGYTSSALQNLAGWMLLWRSYFRLHESYN